MGGWCPPGVWGTGSGKTAARSHGGRRRYGTLSFFPILHNWRTIYVNTLRSEIDSAITYMTHRGVNPNVIYADADTYERLGRISRYRGIEILCDEGLITKFRID